MKTNSRKQEAIATNNHYYKIHGQKINTTSYILQESPDNNKTMKKNIVTINSNPGSHSISTPIFKLVLFKPSSYVEPNNPINEWSQVEESLSPSSSAPFLVPVFEANEIMSTW